MTTSLPTKPIARPPHNYVMLRRVFRHSPQLDVYRTIRSSDGKRIHPAAYYHETRENARSLEDVIAEVQGREEVPAPLAIVPRRDDTPYLVMIDFDAVLQTPFDYAQAYDIVRAVRDITGPSYTEYSNSGRGLHIYLEYTGSEAHRCAYLHRDAEHGWAAEWKAQPDMPLNVTAFCIPRVSVDLAEIDDATMQRLMALFDGWAQTAERRRAAQEAREETAQRAQQRTLYGSLPAEIDAQIAERWLRNGFAGALADLHAAAEHARNNTINAVSYRCGRLVHETYLPLSVVRPDIMRIIEQWPNAKHSIATMDRALKDGMSNPVDLTGLRPHIDYRVSWAEIETIDAGMPLPPDPEPRRAKPSAAVRLPAQAGPLRATPEDPPHPGDGEGSGRVTEILIDHYLGDVGDAIALEPAQWLVENRVYVNGASLIYGDYGSGKTQIAFTVMGDVVAAGRRVLYVPTENARSARSRLLGYLTQYPHLAPRMHEQRYYRWWRGGKLDITDRGSLATLLQVAATIPNLGLIVIDTLRNAFVGDETPGKYAEITRAITAMRELPTQPAVLIVHHTGKDPAKGARGSTSLPASMDVELEITKPDEGDNTTKLRVVRFRDHETPKAPEKWLIRSVTLPDAWCQGLGPEDSRTAPVAVPVSDRDDDAPRRFAKGEAEARVAFVLLRSHHLSFQAVKAIAAETNVPERTVRDTARRYETAGLASVKKISDSITHIKLLAAGRVKLQADVDETKANRPRWLRGLQGAPVIDDEE